MMIQCRCKYDEYNDLSSIYIPVISDIYSYLLAFPSCLFLSDMYRLFLKQFVIGRLSLLSGSSPGSRCTQGTRSMAVMDSLESHNHSGFYINKVGTFDGHKKYEKSGIHLSGRKKSANCLLVGRRYSQSCVEATASFVRWLLGVW